MELDATIRSRAGAMLGQPIRRWEPRGGGLTHATTGLATLGDGSSVFLKAATEDHSTTQVRQELAALQAIQAPFIPHLVAFDPADPPLLALEDLSAGHWPEPFPEDVSLLVDALSQLRSMPIPPGLDPSPLRLASTADWADIEAVAAIGAVPIASWLGANAEVLQMIAETAEGGDSMVHGDLWYSNICFLPDRIVIVDWSDLRVGSPWHDAATVSIDLVIEGRRPLASGPALGWAAVYVAHSIRVLAAGPHASIAHPSRWRIDVEELVDGAAWWLAAELGLTPPPRLSGRNVGWR